jgi:hypothetical protein
MISKIVYTDEVLKISTPKQKSWVLVIVLGSVAIQNTIGIVQSFSLFPELQLFPRIIYILLSSTLIFLCLKVILWQVKGVKEVSIDENNITIRKISPLHKVNKLYAVKELTNISIQDDTVQYGPKAMLQILKIIDKIKITFSFGNKTISAISGIDIHEATEIKNKLENKIALDL